MKEVLTLAVVGLGMGAAYTLLAQGVLLVYRGSGVLNFAQGAVAMTGGFIYYHFRVESGWSFWPAFFVTVCAGALLGTAVYVGPMRFMRNAATLAKVIATLGVLVTLQAAMTLIFGTQGQFVPSFLPSGQLHPLGVPVGESDLILFGIAALLTLVLWLGFRFTTVGLATRAAAANRVGAAALGWSPDALGTANWAMGGALAAAAGVLLAPLAGLQPGTTSLVIIPALAATLIGGFRSFPLTLLGAMALGVAQAEVGNYVHQLGASDAVPFGVLVVVLVIRGRGLPVQGFIAERFSEVGSGRVRWRLLVPAMAATALLMAFVFSAGVVTGLTTSLAYALVMLSIVVLTGYTGQLSLAQIALGGVGALIAGRLVAAQGWPFEFAVLAGMVGASLAGLMFAIPALRTRGVNLAAVTLGLGLALNSMVFANINLTGGVNGTSVAGQHFFGIPIDPVLHPVAYGILVLSLFVVAALGVANLRRGRAGRRLLAVRTNERAAAALGISVVEAKFYAFALSAAIAGLGGILLAFQNDTINWDGFDPFTSILMVAYAVIGGVGFVLGPLYGSLLVVGGIASYITSQLVPGLTNWLALIGGLTLIQILLISPNGLAEEHIRRLTKLRARVYPRGLHAPREHVVPAAVKPVTPAQLEVSGLVVRFGGVTAVNDVSLAVRPGRIVGLIGPNGAGKSTVINAVTGFVKPAGGRILLDGRPIDGWSVVRRARAGVARSFQSLELFEDVSILENLRAASDSRDRLAYLTNLFAPRNRRLGPEVVAAIHEFGLVDELHRRPTEISYGKRRLAAVARAVAAAPSILLLDEPAAGLSESETRELGILLRRLASDRGLGILLVEHDLALVLDVCDELTVLDFGRQIASGAPAAVRTDPAVIAAYIGEPEPDPAPATAALLGGV